MRTRRLTACLAAFGATAVVLAGCSSSSDKGADDAEPVSPLGEYLNAVYGGDLSPEEQQAQSEEQNRKVEELVADCMQEEGFEYVPNTSNGGFVSSDDVPWEPDDREWVQQWGYGAVNNPYNEQPTPAEDEYVDPNADYVSSLSESEQNAFNEALYGPQPTEEEIEAMGDEPQEYDWTTAGCYGAAQHEVYEASDPTQSDEFAPLMDAINEFYENSQDDPALAELDAAWASCMDAAGHPGFTKQFDAQNSIYEAQNDLYSPSGDDGEYVEPSQADTDALGEEEIELALADLDCREETDYREKSQDIQFGLEEQFVADHETELEALRAAAAQD